SLRERINGCMIRSMNGRVLPEQGREMEAMVAYIRFAGLDSPQGIRLPGMGLVHMAGPKEAPDERRGGGLYAEQCANCHKPDGGGERAPAPAIGYAIPPLWDRSILRRA
ncbi:MAG: c-type cytochrome, partial [Hyphomicrobiales bacterium]